MKNRFIVCFCVSILFLVFLCSAQASIVSFNLNTIFSGTGVPTNPAPWATATITDVSPGQVTLTVVASGLTANEKVKDVYLNLDPALNPTLLVSSGFTKTGTFTTPTITGSANAYKADGDGYYDIDVAFDTGNSNKTFDGGEAVSCTLTLTGLTASSFNFVSSSGGGQGQYYIAAQLQNLGTSGQSAWVTPEPATLMLLGLGAFALRRRK